MSIVDALVAARGQMAALIADESAKIATRQGGEFKFKYVSLPQLIETVTPALLANGVILVQDVGTHQATPSLVGITTKLIHKQDSIKSETIWFTTDGTPRDLGMKVTTARRVQLMALLGLAVSDDDDNQPPAARQPAPYQRTQQVQPTGVTSKTVVDTGVPWGEQVEHRRAVTVSNASRMSDALKALMLKVRHDDKDGDPMPITPAEGKTVSMYDYLLGLVGAQPEVVLSFLYGRVVSRLTPPTLGTRWIIDELREKKLDDDINEVVAILGGKT